MKVFAPHMVDGYKLGHASMYTPGTDFLYSNLTPRNDKFFKGGRLYDSKMVVYGAQGALQEIVEDWENSFFSQPKAKVIARYKRRVDGYLGVGVVSVERMAALHDKGYLPLIIKTIDEGSRIPMKIPMLTIQNTDPEFFWLVNYLETALSDMIWKSTTNATIAYEYKRILTDWATKTGSPVAGVLFQGHDFSMRGMSGYEDASRSGSAHLTSFNGTDTLGAIDYIEDYYGTDKIEDGLEFIKSLDKDYLIGASIPATEHAVSSSNILVLERVLNKETNHDHDNRLEAEIAFMKDFITRLNPTGYCSYVADTYDYWGVVGTVLPALKDVIAARDGKLVIRPDSGDPVEIVCGTLPIIDKMACYNVETAANIATAQLLRIDDKNGTVKADCSRNFHKFVWKNTVFKAEYIVDDSRQHSWDIVENHTDYEVVSVVEVPSAELTMEEKGSIEVLWEIFGGTVNDKGYKVLDSHIGLIYGDSITMERADKILSRLAAKGFASENVVFGIGSYTYQANTRDTFGTAMKATATSVDGNFIEIYKDPKTGDGLKKSAKGLLQVILIDGEYILRDQVSKEDEKYGELITRYEDGLFLNLDSIETIRKRLA